MSANDSVYLLMLGSGLLGGLGHCSAMCGPIVAAYSLRLGSVDSPAKIRAGLPHLFYNAGRITTYSIIGGIMGLTGSFAGVQQTIGRFQNITMAAIGAVMVLMGLAASGLFSFNRKEGTTKTQGNATAMLADLVRRIIAFIAGTQTSGAFYAMGMATGFIPCGLLYTAYIAAAGAGAGADGRVDGFLTGMLMLFLFGLGTAPSLVLIGRIAALRQDWIRKRLYRASAFFMMIIGAMLIYRALVF